MNGIDFFHFIIYFCVFNQEKVNSNMNKTTIIILLLGLCTYGIQAQKRKNDDTSVYHVNKALEIPLTIAS